MRSLYLLQSFLLVLLLLLFFFLFSSLSNPEIKTMSPKDSSETTQSEITLQLARKEHAEHMEGMDEAAANVIKRPLIIKAYALDDPNAPTGENVKTCHFVRHGQGFHNLMADVARSQGRTWVSVSSLGGAGRDSFVSQFAHICFKEFQNARKSLLHV